MQSPYSIAPNFYLAYKVLNSLFLGLSLGTVFKIYTPLEPIVFSIGGIALAVATMMLASQYYRILQIDYFYGISLFVEFAILLVVILFLVFSINKHTAMAIYIGYQITFIFGSYLLRCETLLLPDTKMLTKLDLAKQTGYLAGLAVSYLFYKILTDFYGISDSNKQIHAMHFALLVTQVLVITSLFLAFKPNHDGIGRSLRFKKPTL